MHPGDVFVEDQGVGDDGAGHAAGLGYVDHSQASGYFISDARSQLRDFVQVLCCPFDAFFQSGGGAIDSPLGNRYEAHHVNQIFDRALQPAGFGEALDVVGILGEDAVGEAGRGQGGAQVVGIAHRGWVSEGDDCFDDASVGGQLKPEASPGLRFYRTRGHVLGLDDDGRAAWHGDDDVGAQPGLTGDGLCVFGTHLATGQHVLEQTAQSVIGVRLRLAGHGTSRTLRTAVGTQREYPI